MTQKVGKVDLETRGRYLIFTVVIGNQGLVHFTKHLEHKAEITGSWCGVTKKGIQNKVNFLYIGITRLGPGAVTTLTIRISVFM